MGSPEQSLLHLGTRFSMEPGMEAPGEAGPAWSGGSSLRESAASALSRWRMGVQIQ